MRTRLKGYSDYGFTAEEYKDLKAYCKSAYFREHAELLRCAIQSNPDISNDLYYSLVSGLSYDDIDRIKYVAISKVDFYGYQRKCLGLFKEKMKRDD